MWWIASEGRQRVPGSRMLGGQSAVMPVGTIHAVESLTEEVACGLPLHDLFLFRDRNWNSIDSSLTCRDCKAEMTAFPHPAG